MFAAQALDLHNIGVTIFSKKRKSEIYGAQYLHAPIPGLSPQDPNGTIHTLRAGTAEVYAERVYGLGTMPTSWSKVRQFAPAWDLRATYNAAWQKFERYIIDGAFDAERAAEIIPHFELVISTVPAWAICAKPNEHVFRSQNILVRKHIELLNLPQTLDEAENWVLYNGTWQNQWYRASSIFGHTSAEARSEPALQILKGWEPGFKVIGTDCDCHPEIVRAGRMGKWTRGVLTHHAFQQTIDLIADCFGITVRS